MIVNDLAFAGHMIRSVCVESIHDSVFVHDFSCWFTEPAVGYLVVCISSVMSVLWGYLRLFQYGQVRSVSWCIHSC